MADYPHASVAPKRDTLSALRDLQANLGKRGWTERPNGEWSLQIDEDRALWIAFTWTHGQVRVAVWLRTRGGGVAQTRAVRDFQAITDPREVELLPSSLEGWVGQYQEGTADWPPEGFHR